MCSVNPKGQLTECLLRWAWQNREIARLLCRIAQRWLPAFEHTYRQSDLNMQINSRCVLGRAATIWAALQLSQ